MNFTETHRGLSRYSRPLCGILAGYLQALALLSAMLTCPGAWAAQPDVQAAQGLIAATAERMLTRLRAEGDALRNHPERIHALARQEMFPHIDFDAMSRLVLGKAWREATPANRTRFIEEFKQFLLRFYTGAFLELTKGHEIPADFIRFQPLRASTGDDKVTVRSVLRTPGGGAPIPVDYRMFLSDGQWKVYDVDIDGISLVSSYRGSFATEIRTGGLDGLIGSLAKRNAELTGR